MYAFVRVCVYVFVFVCAFVCRTIPHSGAVGMYVYMLCELVVCQSCQVYTTYQSLLICIHTYCIEIPKCKKLLACPSSEGIQTPIVLC